MKNVLILIGASGSGKDYIQRHLISNYTFTPIVSYTSRPIRPNETNGVDYHFITRDKFLNMIKDNKLIEYRKYSTLYHGVSDTWYYGTKKQLFDNDKTYVMILTPQGARDFIKYYGKEKCSIVFIYCDNLEREKRAMNRGGFSKTEWQRRLIQDSIDFEPTSTLKLSDIQIDNSYNQNIDEICKLIVDKLS